MFRAALPERRLMVHHMGNFNERGYTLAAALTMIAVMSIFMALSVPLWSWVKQRDNEEELIFRGREYVEAIARYHARFQTYPPDLETLYKQKYIRKLYKDPMTESGKWKVLRPDSLLQTGAAGQILQPGAGNQPAPAGEEDDADQSSSLFPQSNEPHETQKESEGETEVASGEEPESEVIGPVAGVASRNRQKSIKLYNGQQYYNKWIFVHVAPQQQQQPPQGKPPKGAEQKKNKKDQQKKSPVETPSEEN